MKLLNGFTLVELTEDKIVQEYRFGNGVIRMTGNPNPPKEEHDKAMQAVAKILIKGVQLKAMEQKRNGEVDTAI